MFELNPYKERKETGKNGVERKFVQAVQRAGGKAFKFTSEMNRGVSDRLVVFPGQVWFVEVKRKSGKLTPLQEHFRQFIKDFRLNHYTVYGTEQIQDFLNKVKEAENDNS